MTTITIPIFGYDIALFEDSDEMDDWIESIIHEDYELDHLDPGTYYARVVHFKTVDGSNAMAAYIPKDVPIYVIVHESVHLAWYVLDEAAVGIDADNHEIHAYLTDYIFQQLYNEVKGNEKRSPELRYLDSLGSFTIDHDLDVESGDMVLWQIQGNRNDREWVEVGRGETPTLVIRNAIDKQGN